MILLNVPVVRGERAQQRLEIRQAELHHSVRVNARLRMLDTALDRVVACESVGAWLGIVVVMMPLDVLMLAMRAVCRMGHAGGVREITPTQVRGKLVPGGYIVRAHSIG